MAEYIEREKALNIFGDIPEGYGYYKPFTFPVSRTTREAITLFKKEINKITAADVAPVKHGRWEMRPTGMMTEYGPELKAFCTACNNSNKQYQPPYCPHCGAKMDGDRIEGDE